MLHFWRWCSSNLINNTSRGNLAEFLVARAVGATSETRSTWDDVDVVTPSGIKVEVKSSAYLQDWAQSRHSRPCFDIAPSRGWDRETGRSQTDSRRHADVYAFCLLHHKDKDTLDPLELSQWSFFTVPTIALNARHDAQKTIGLKAIGSLIDSGFAKPATFLELDVAVRWAARLQRQTHT